MKEDLRKRQRRFSNTFDTIVRNLSGTGRGRKQLLGMGVDGVLVVVSLWLSYSLRLGQPFGEWRSTLHLFLLLPAITVLLFAALGIYRWVVRSSNSRLYRQLAKGCVLSALALVLLIFLATPDGNNPRSVFGIYGAVLLITTCGLRVVWQSLFDEASRGEPIAIYGAGSAGRQLASHLANGAEYRPVAFIDDSKSLHGTTVLGLPVIDSEDFGLGTALIRREVGRIVLAIPSIGGSAYRACLERLEPLGLPVQTMPGVAELVTGKARPDEIRDISIGDIHGRIEVIPDMEVIGRRVAARTVLVTGGGGSIGSELCRQIAGLEPARLIVLDNCEANLYHITEELGGSELDLVPMLGSVTDRVRLERLVRDHAVDTVYHAAAYKHVPIVESQPDQGLATNVFGTLTLLEVAETHGVSDFVLISTDKAVRPTNAMGASKRAAELVLQAKAHMGGSMRISMVRFGNVLGSSGSVVPKFKQQIRENGPITVTHPEITRYFMTIPEAAQLVLQASAIARGGDVFVLDMGEPVKILDLARTMVRLSGKRLREETGDEGDIAIEFEGLRPGEKMYEELFITDSHQPTSVPKVFTADEVWLPWDELRHRLDVLARISERGDADTLREELKSLAAAGWRNGRSPDLDMPPEMTNGGLERDSECQEEAVV